MGPLGGEDEAKLGHVGVKLPSGKQLGGILSHLGGNLEAILKLANVRLFLKATWKRLGVVLGRLEVVLAPSWSHLGATWSRLGASLGALGAILGPSWGHLGAILGPFWG